MRTALYFVAGTFALLLPMNLSFAEADGPSRLPGLCFGPYRDGESPVTGIQPLPEALEQDIRYLALMTDAIRTYSVSNSLGLIPAICEKHKVGCYPGAWIGSSEEQNDAELATLISLMQKKSKSVRGAIVGNEVVLRGDLSTEQLIANLRRVRNKLPKDVPVGTAEPWHVWEMNPSLAGEVDILFVHVFAYWDGVAVENAAPYVIERLTKLRHLYPDKQIVLAEHGWPSAGDTKGAAIPGPEAQAAYLAAIVPMLHDKRIPNFVFSFADEQWKSPEGGVEANWGLLTSSGRVKDSVRQLLPTAAQVGLTRPPRESTNP